jgi:hypothetical protein
MNHDPSHCDGPAAGCQCQVASHGDSDGPGPGIRLVRASEPGIGTDSVDDSMIGTGRRRPGPPAGGPPAAVRVTVPVRGATDSDSH